MKKITNIFIGLISLSLLAVGIVYRDEPVFFWTLSTNAVVIFLMLFAMQALSKNQATKVRRLENRLLTKDKQIRQKKEIESHILYYHSIGVLLLENEDTIVYSNKIINDLFGMTLQGKQLELIHPALYEGIKRHPETRPVVLINSQQFEVAYVPTRKTVYLSPVTERELLRQKTIDETPFIGYFQFDQIEETLDALDRQERNALLNEMLGSIETWAKPFHFQVVALNERITLVMGYRKELKKAMDEDFSFLKDLAEIGQQRELILTVSGGIALASIPFDELSDIADQAMNTAVTRGGDQIVLNEEGETLKYYGGNPQNHEKRTRIAARIHAQKLSRLMDQVDDVFIAPHQHADTDAIGASIGILKMAEAMNKKVKILLDPYDVTESVKKILALMDDTSPLKNVFTTPYEAMAGSHHDSLLILVDHHSEGQLLSTKLIQTFQRYAIIDHHRLLDDALTNGQFMYLEPYASSTSELVVEMIKVFQPSTGLSPLEATIMLSGIIVDTNNFLHRTGSRTYEAAGLLRAYGADSLKINNILRESADVVQLKAKYVASAEVFLGRFSMVVIPNHEIIDRTMLAKIADDQLKISHIEASFTIGRLNDKIIGISARSVDRFNVQEMMEQMGGGGHLNNAATQIEAPHVKDVKAQVIQALDAFDKEGETMKVILLKDVKNKGKKDEVIDVAAGYGNYLVSSNLAKPASDENLDALKAAQAERKEAEIKALADAKALKERIQFRAVKLPLKVGDSGKLFAKVNTKMIADAFQDQHDLSLDKRKIQLSQKIDALGTYKVDIKLHKDVSATFEVMVTEE